MALIYPFHGLRYNRDKAGDLNLVMTQPYDKISSEMQRDYYGRSPFNVVRITKNSEKNEDGETTYPDAAATFERWISEGLLVPDPKPAIYAYFREYEVEGEQRCQKGFIALLDLAHAAGGILPHERTLAEPKADRLRLMRGTESNDDLIYMLFTDDRLVTDQILDEAASRLPPDIEVKDDFGAIHRVWLVTEAQALKKMRDAMVPEELFIADGHHRFETSVAFMNECRSRGWRPGGPESFDKRMVACFNSAAPGITILPTHRLVHALPSLDSASFLRRAGQYFQTRKMKSPEALWGAMKEGRGREHVFGFFGADIRRPWLLTLKEEAKVDPLMLAHGEAYRHLDASILHTLLLESILGIDEAKLVAQTHVEYARDREACIRAVNDGKHQAAFFLNPTTVEQMQRVALLGERMPQKSTDFYPKLLTGLVFMKMSIARR
jgi:uncharacterized protein (DUF1015 family)